MTHEEKMLALCDNIRRLRKESGMTLHAMAHALGTSVQTLSSLEHNVIPKRLRYAVLIRAARCFQMTTEELFLPVEE